MAKKNTEEVACLTDSLAHQSLKISMHCSYEGGLKEVPANLEEELYIIYPCLNITYFTLCNLPVILGYIWISLITYLPTGSTEISGSQNLTLFLIYSQCKFPWCIEISITYTTVRRQLKYNVHSFNSQVKSYFLLKKWLLFHCIRWTEFGRS